MVVISYKAIRDFVRQYRDAEESLNNWYIIATETDWRNFNEIRQLFGSCDAVGNDLYVFNIHGNKYRLIVRIIFRVRTIYIKFVGTHQEYDKVNLNDL